MASGMIGGDVAPSNRKASDMEELCERLGSTLVRVREYNDSTSAKLDHFHGTHGNKPDATPAALSPAPAPPGTLTCLRELASGLAAEADRTEMNLSRLRSTF